MLHRCIARPRRHCGAQQRPHGQNPEARVCDSLSVRVVATATRHQAVQMRGRGLCAGGALRRAARAAAALAAATSGSAEPPQRAGAPWQWRRPQSDACRAVAAQNGRRRRGGRAAGSLCQRRGGRAAGSLCQRRNGSGGGARRARPEPPRAAKRPSLTSALARQAGKALRGRDAPQAAQQDREGNAMWWRQCTHVMLRYALSLLQFFKSAV